MSALTWEFHAPTNTWKNHFMSDKLYEASWELAVFQDWVQAIPGYGKKRGESVDLFTITGPGEPTTAQLQEGVRIPEDTVTLSSTRLTVAEFGRAITHTSLWEMLAKYDVTNFVQKRLRRQMALTFDTKSASIFKTAKVIFIPTGVASGVFDTDGTPSTTATDNLTLYHVQRVRDEMYGVYQIPFFDGNNYVWICNFRALRGIKDDPNWQQWKIFTTPEALANGEVGTIESCRFIETNHSDALTTVGTGSVLGECVAFGDEAVAFAEAETPELRMKPSDDYGREMGVAWYGVLGWQLFHDTANAGEARIVRIASA